MVSVLFVVLAVVAVPAVYLVIGRLGIPAEDRVPLRELGLRGWWHTLRRSLVVLGECAPPGGIRPL